MNEYYPSSYSSDVTISSLSSSPYGNLHPAPGIFIPTKHIDKSTGYVSSLREKSSKLYNYDERASSNRSKIITALAAQGESQFGTFQRRVPLHPKDSTDRGFLDSRKAKQWSNLRHLKSQTRTASAKRSDGRKGSNKRTSKRRSSSSKRKSVPIPSDISFTTSRVAAKTNLKHRRSLSRSAPKYTFHGKVSRASRGSTSRKTASNIGTPRSGEVPERLPRTLGRSRALAPTTSICLHDEPPNSQDCLTKARSGTKEASFSLSRPKREVVPSWWALPPKIPGDGVHRELMTETPLEEAMMLARTCPLEGQKCQIEVTTSKESVPSEAIQRARSPSIGKWLVSHNQTDWTYAIKEETLLHSAMLEVEVPPLEFDDCIDGDSQIAIAEKTTTDLAEDLSSLDLLSREMGNSVDQSRGGTRLGGIRKRLLAIFSISLPLLLTGFESARTYNVEVTQEGETWLWFPGSTSARNESRLVFLISEVAYTLGVLLIVLVHYCMDTGLYSKRLLSIISLIVHIVGSVLLLVYSSLYTFILSRLIVGAACAFELWVVLTWNFESVLTSGMALTSVVGMFLFAAGTLLVKVVELARIYTKSSYLLKPFCLQNVVLVALAVILLLVMTVVSRYPRDSTVGHMRKRKAVAALRSILIFNPELSVADGRNTLQRAVNSMRRPEVSLIGLLKRSVTFRQQFVVLVTHFLWAGLGSSVLFNGVAEEVLYLPSTSGVDISSPTAVMIITTAAPLITYLPAYRVLRSVNRATLLAISTFVEGTLILIAALSLSNWRPSTCEMKLNTSVTPPRQPSHWLAVICVLAYQQILFSFTMPATICNAMQTMKLREAPVALLWGIICLWLPALLSEIVSYVVATSHGDDALCGASGRLFGISVTAFLASMASFFCIDNSKTLGDSPYSRLWLKACCSSHSRYA